MPTPAARDAAADARALARLLALGFASARDVVAWVDRRIADSSTPHPFLIDASLSEKRRDALIAALEGFATDVGVGDPSAVWAAVLGGLHSWLLSHPHDGPGIARALYGMAVAGELPDRDAEPTMYALDDRYALALDGAYGERHDVDGALRTFLVRYAAVAPLTEG
jgi:hypothetical protein